VNVVFDFGGVLFRWQPHEFMPRLLPHRATNETAASTLVTDFFQGYSGDWDDFDRGAADEAIVARRIAWRTGLDLAESAESDRHDPLGTAIDGPFRALAAKVEGEWAPLVLPVEHAQALCRQARGGASAGGVVRRRLVLFAHRDGETRAGDFS
jgi:FMN phosphatase YigB (HAD superfamily)